LSAAGPPVAVRLRREAVVWPEGQRALRGVGGDKPPRVPEVVPRHQDLARSAVAYSVAGACTHVRVAVVAGNSFRPQEAPACRCRGTPPRSPPARTRRRARVRARRTRRAGAASAASRSSFLSRRSPTRARSRPTRRSSCCVPRSRSRASAARARRNPSEAARSDTRIVTWSNMEALAPLQSDPRTRPWG
jgi:hypothetical protein